MTEQTEAGYLTAQELAERASVHTNTVYRWVDEGCPHRKVGSRKLAFVWSEVDDWLRERS